MPSTGACSAGPVSTPRSSAGGSATRSPDSLRALADRVAELDPFVRQRDALGDVHHRRHLEVEVRPELGGPLGDAGGIVGLDDRAAAGSVESVEELVKR